MNSTGQLKLKPLDIQNITYNICHIVNYVFYTYHNRIQQYCSYVVEKCSVLKKITSLKNNTREKEIKRKLLTSYGKSPPWNSDPLTWTKLNEKNSKQLKISNSLSMNACKSRWEHLWVIESKLEREFDVLSFGLGL